MTLLIFIGLGFWALSLVMVCSGTLLSFLHRRISGENRHPVGKSISVLKPIKGLEEGLRQNLQSFFDLDYPNLELIFCVSDPHDPARDLVEELMHKNPNVVAKLIVGGSHLGLNPKINNLYVGYKTAKYDLMLISDSNIRARKNYLWQITSHMRPGVGLVTSAVEGSGVESVGAKLEQSYLNTYLTRWLHLSHFVGQPIIMGKSMLFRKSTLERCGGLKALKDDVAEDYASGLLMKKYHLKIALMSEPVSQHLGKFSLVDFWMRHLRWGRIRKAYAPIAFLMEPLSSAFGSGMVGAAALSYYTESSFLLVLLAHLALWCANDLFLRADRNEKITTSMFFAWLVGEFLSVPIWVHTVMGREVDWRGNRLTLAHGGKVVGGGGEEYRVEPTFEENPAVWETQEIPIMYIR